MSQEARIQKLAEELNTQDDCFTRTPLFCVYERDNPDDPEDGNGWPASIFLTEERAEWYMKKVHYRLRNPYIYVRGPGENSELHELIQWLRERKEKNLTTENTENHGGKR